MKKNNYKNQLKVINASRGMERRDVLNNGGIWTSSTMCMEKNMIVVDRSWNLENIHSISSADFIAGKQMGKEHIYGDER